MAGEQHPFDLPHDPEVVQPGVGDGAPQGGTPVSEPPDYKRLYEESNQKVERLKPLEPFAEMLADPTVRATALQRLFGSGAPVEAAPTVDPRAALSTTEAAIRAKYKPQMEAAIAAGDFTTYGEVTANMGAEIGEARSSANMNAAAGPLVNMTAQNTIENWVANKRATSPLFQKLEAQMRAEIAKTPPAKMAELVTNGTLHAALEAAWGVLAGKAYEQSYNKASAEGRLDNRRPEPPNYSMGNRGGSPPREQVETDDADDEEFNKLMAASGVRFRTDGTGAITGEVS